MIVQLVRTGARDEPAEVVNFLNELFDLVRVTPVLIPDKYRTVLHGLADHATFSCELAEYLDANPERRVLALDTLDWSIGAVSMDARLLT